jgi:hypothetical protein
VAGPRPVESGARTARDTRMRAVRLGLWLAGAATGAWLLIDVLTAAAVPTEERVLALAVVVMGCSFMACGLVAWRHRPGKRLGRLMVILGAVWLAALAAQTSTSGLLTTVGLLVLDGWVILLVYFLVSFPSGRLTSRTDRLLVAPFAFTAGPMAVVWLLFFDFGPDAPPNVLLVWPDADVADAIDTAQRVIFVTATFVVVAVLGARWRRASPPLRRGLTPILVGAAALLVSNVQLVLTKLAEVETYLWVQTAMFVVIALVPYMVLIDMLRERLARSAVGDLVLALHASPAPEDLRDAIARALGDRLCASRTGCPTTTPTPISTDSRSSSPPTALAGPASSTARARPWRRCCTTRRCTTSPRCSTPSAPRPASRSSARGSTPTCTRDWTSCAARAPASSRPPRASAAGSSATYTTARSSGSSRSRWTSG